MPFFVAASTAPETADAVAEVVAKARANSPEKPDLALVFFSPHHAGSAAVIGRALYKQVEPRRLLGCVGECVIADDREFEDEPALSVWLARWSRPVEMESFHLRLERTSEGPSLLGWPDSLVGATAAQTTVLLLGDPFTFPVDPFLTQMNEDAPGVRVLGGMASGASGPGQSDLLLDGGVRDGGAVGVVLQGDIGLRSIVSQGCRPIGRHMVITKAEENIILELGGRTPMEQLQELWESLGAHERQLFQKGLHVGRVINEYRGDFQRGDFLVRNVLGLIRDSGALAIAERVRVGQTVQFHVRDAETADEDLHALLQLDLHAHEKKPAAALVFSCNGRGTRLFPAPNHDAGAVRAEAGAIPVAGFFAQGELGPVGGQNFIHGFTASVALFEE
jgi:small ligand-binding sensory domain FIST